MDAVVMLVKQAAESSLLSTLLGCQKSSYLTVKDLRFYHPFLYLSHQVTRSYSNLCKVYTKLLPFHLVKYIFNAFLWCSVKLSSLCWTCTPATQYSKDFLPLSLVFYKLQVAAPFLPMHSQVHPSPAQLNL